MRKRYDDPTLWGLQMPYWGMDEILPLKDPRVQSNPAYLVVILLSRVVVRLGSLEAVTPKVIEGLFASDLAFLQSIPRQSPLNPAATASRRPGSGSRSAAGLPHTTPSPG